MANIDTRQRYFLQCDWNEALSAKEQFWLSYNKVEFRLSTKNFKELICANNNQDVAKNVFEILQFSTRALVLKDLATGATHRFVAPLKVYKDAHTKTVSSVDVAPNGLVVSAAFDAVKVWDIVSGQSKLELKGHFSDVKKCRFFPSNEVILTVGNDMQMKVWSAIDGQCPVTMLGHKGYINDVQIVDRGRNIISVGADGFVKLWCVAKAACIEDLFDPTREYGLAPTPAKGVGSILCCRIQRFAPDSDKSVKRTKPLLADANGTEDKVLVFGSDSGLLVLLAVHAAQPLCTLSFDSPVNCVEFLAGPHTIACGLKNGELHLVRVVVVDGVHRLERLFCWNYSTSSVLSLCAVKTNEHAGGVVSGFLAGRQDGSLHFLDTSNSSTTANSNGANSNQITYLTGSDCDPINDIVFDGERYFHTACRDGKIRKYSIDSILMH